MTKYRFETPEQMFHWIDECAKKLLTIPREEFEKIEIDIHRTSMGSNYGFLIEPEVKNIYKKRFENEKN